MNNENLIEFNFTYFALKALGNSLYSNPWVAVSELVANGLDAGAKNVKVLIDLRNKNRATIEIFDNGCGMNYDDIAYKYAIIGRNRREESPNEKTFGRKGVGKLAALYLASKYYIFTKTQAGSSCWEMDSTKFKDSDVPGLAKINENIIQIISDKDWNSYTTGTLIKLVNVDLSLIGEKKIESLKAILADYYLSEIFATTISVAVLKDEESMCPIVFESITKNIYFDAFYGIFDTTGENSSKIKKAVYLTGENEVHAELDYPRETIMVKSDLPCIDTIQMLNSNGAPITVPYELRGWIGINCSLKEETQRRNSSNYKKMFYRGNELRLYVNGKLAVADIIKYIGSNQVNANYIEGEISFDVLDRSDLEDTATSNRESYKLEDPRVKRLIEIIKPIVTKLINARSKIGSLINQQNQNLINAKEKEVITIKERNEEINKILIKTNKDKENLKRKNIIAEKRLFVLEKNFIGDGENYKNGMHLAVNYSKAIKAIAIKLIKKLNIKENIFLGDIVRYAENIIRLNKILNNAKFPLTSSEIKENLLIFIKDYVKIVSTSSIEIECNFNNYEYVTDFDFCEMSMALENIISNSKKAKAKKIKIEYKIENKKKHLIFKDDGTGLASTINDPNIIFDLGFSTTHGYGIGSFLIKKVFDKLTNEINIKNENGFALIMEMK